MTKPKIYDPDFKYTPASRSGVEHDYLRKKFKRLIAEQKAQLEAEREAANKAGKSVLRLRRQA